MMRIFVTFLVFAVLASTSVAIAQEQVPAPKPPAAPTEVKKDRSGKAKKARPKARKSKRLNRAGCFIRKPWVCRQDGNSVVKPRKLGWHLNKKMFGKQHWPALNFLWGGESGWKPFEPRQWGKVPLMNKQGSGACGIPQALPCSKIPNPRSVMSQIKWGLRYIKNRYGNPSKALAFWRAQRPSHWY